MKKAKLWQFFEIVGGTTPGTSNPDYWNGSILWVTPSDFQADILDVINTTQKRVTKKAVDECNLFVGEEGTIVFSSRAPIGKVAIANIPVCTNQGCKLIYPRIKGIFNIRFVAYWLLANKERLNNLGSGTTFREISTRTLSRFEIPTIPIEDQNQIVDLLDSKIKKVDSLLSKKIKLQTSLEEYKQSIVTRAVTKGLDPNVPMKDSGIPWIGQIPAHWSIGRIWHHYILSNGLSKGGEFFGSGYPFVTYGDVYRSESLPAIPTGLANTTVDERKK